MKKWSWFLVSVLIIALDQSSKALALSYLTAYEAKPLMPMFNLTLAYNSGAAFSFLSGAGYWHHYFFAFINISICIAICIWLIRLPQTKKLQAFALSFILGGAIGNLIDRALLGHVIDFIDVYYQHHHWPVFNLADSAICIGAFLLIIDTFEGKKHSDEPKTCFK